MSDHRIGFGAANLGNLHRAMTDDDAWAILEAAWNGGVRYFDTAPHYGLGLAERRLGAFLRTRHRDEFTVSTKVGRMLVPNPNFTGGDDMSASFAVPDNHLRAWDFSRDGIRRSLDSSLQRLGLDRIDTLLLHDPDQYRLDKADDEAYPALEELRREGAISSAGVATMSVEAVERASRHSGVNAIMVAGRLTLAEQPAAPAITAVPPGTSVMAASVFNSGLLAQSQPDASARYDYGLVTVGLLRKVRAIERVCEDHGVDLPTAALHFPLTIPGVTTVVIAGANASHVTQNLTRLATSVPSEMWDDLVQLGLLTTPRRRNSA